MKLSGGEVQGAVPSTSNPVRNEQGQELHGGRGQVPGVPAQPAGTGQGERVRRSSQSREEGSAVPLRLVHQIENFAGMTFMGYILKGQYFFLQD